MTLNCLFPILDICHNYQTFNKAYSDTGLFGVLVVCEPMQAFDAGRAVIRAAQRLATDVTDAELDVAKKRLCGKLCDKLYCEHFIATALC